MPEVQSRRSGCAQSSKTKHTVVAPLSPRSDDGAVKSGAGDEAKIPCFFAVLDPENTAKLKGTKHSACLTGFPDVNRLREHLWRAHSPTHNCRICRKKTTKPTAQFRQEHALCRPGVNIKSRPYPELISTAQAEALQNLNQHFNKPNNEVARCEKLLKALFPNEKFEEERFMSSRSTAGASRGKAISDRNHTHSTSRQESQRQSQTTKTVSRPQNTTPPASPIAAERPTLGKGGEDSGPLFPVVNKPKGPYSVAPGTPSLDSGLGMEPATPDESNRRESSRTPSLGSGKARRQSTVNSNINGVGTGFPGLPKTATYARRVTVLDGDPGEESTPPVDENYPVLRHPTPESPRSSRISISSRSTSSASRASQSDTEMGQGEETEDGEEEDSDTDDINSTGGDSGFGEDSSDVEMCDGTEVYASRDYMDAVQALTSREFDIAANGCVWTSDMSVDSDSDN